MNGIKVRDVAYPILQVPDLGIQETFLIDFGMKRVSLENDILYMRGSGNQNYISVTQKGEKSFIGLAFYAQSENDLKKISGTGPFSEVQEIQSPGGGIKVSAKDPDNILVEIVFGIAEREPDHEALSPKPSNLGGVGKENYQRINETKRVGKPRSSTIKKLGHIGINVLDPNKSFDWYNEYLGFIASDVIEIAPNTIGAFFTRCDLGDAPTDHHSLLIQSNIPSEMKSGLNHISYEVTDIDDVFLGHEMLKEKGYRHEWGIGRHYLGSQVFDYWRSPFNHVYEHMTDSDVFDNTVKTGTTNIAEATGMQWGPDITQTFGNEEGV